MEPKQIRTLAELQEEQLKLRIRIASSKREFLQSAGKTTSLGRQFLLQKLLVTAGVAGLGVAATRYFMAAASNKEVESKASHSGRWLLQLLLTGVPIILQYFSDRGKGEEAEDETGDYESASPSGLFHEKPTVGNWLSALVPVAVTVMQKLMEDDDDEASGENTPAHQSAKT